MATKTQISVEEYLALKFPDRSEAEYIDGEILERSLPVPIHTYIQGSLVRKAQWFYEIISPLRQNTSSLGVPCQFASRR